MRAHVGDDGIQWVDLYLMRHRTAVYSFSICLARVEDLDPDQDLESMNRRMGAIVWRGLRREAKLAAQKANRKKKRNVHAPRPHP